MCNVYASHKSTCALDDEHQSSLCAKQSSLCAKQSSLCAKQSSQSWPHVSVWQCESKNEWHCLITGKPLSLTLSASFSVTLLYCHPLSQWIQIWHVISSKVLELTVCCMRKLHADYISRLIIAPDVKPFPKKSGTIINHFLLLFHLLLYFRYVS